MLENALIMANIARMSNFIFRHEKRIPFFLGLVFMAVTIPGIAWGAPDIRNPDELVMRVDHAFSGDFSFFDQQNFDYPSLPKYVMYGIGYIVYKMGFTKADFVIAARLLSVLLGGCVVMMTYRITRRLGGKPVAGIFAGLITSFSSLMTGNARFAHNDLYLTFFIILVVYFSIRYWETKQRLWLYTAFLSVGLAASSKYNGVILVLVPLVLFGLWCAQVKKISLSSIETLFIGLILSFGGYALGTPKSLLWMAFYLKRMMPAFLRNGEYGHRPDKLIGFLGQWQIFIDAVGILVFLIFLAAFIWFVIRLVRKSLRRESIVGDRLHLVSIVVLAIIAFDIPLWFSYNYPPRFFLPLIPMFSILVGIFAQGIMDKVIKSRFLFARWLVGMVGIVIIVVSLLRVISVMLLFMNDARNDASAFLTTLPTGTSIENTFYPPHVDEGQFMRVQRYPIYITKYMGQPPAPTNRSYNQGEAGLIERGTDYLLIDSFTYTYDDFNNPWICQENSVECNFHKQLVMGQTRYKLIKSFSYELPQYLPKLTVDFVNPVIQIYKYVK
jgi:hypothetical protein